MEFNHTCRKCKYLKLTRKSNKKPWTCELKKKNKCFEDTIFNNLGSDFEGKG